MYKKNNLPNIACIVESPFQLYTIMNILSLEELTDKRIVFFFLNRSMSDFYTLYPKEECFEFVDLSSIFKTAKIKFRFLMRLYLVCYLYCNKVLINKRIHNIFNRVYVSSPSIPAQVVLWKIRKLNKAVDVFMYEDGMRTYLPSL